MPGGGSSLLTASDRKRTGDGNVQKRNVSEAARVGGNERPGWAGHAGCHHGQGGERAEHAILGT